MKTDETVPENVQTDCWFGEPDPGDRRSWAIPPAHGTYDEIELERLDPDDEDDLRLLLEAKHPEYADALRGHEEMVLDGEPFSPTAHVAMHHVVARQLLTDNPPDTWQTVRRLAGLGYDWHNIMHMIAGLVAEDVHRVMTQGARFDAADYARRLNRLPGDWPPPGSV